MANVTSPIILDSTGQDIVTALNRIGSKTASDVTYDGTVSGLSADDVQEAIDELASEKQDTLTFDASPTDNSSNPVTSDGVYDGIESAYQLVEDTVGWSSKNIYDYSSLETRSTPLSGGITYNDNGNGTVSITAGTTTGIFFTPNHSYKEENLNIPLKPSTEYIFSITEAVENLKLEIYYKPTSNDVFTLLKSETGVKEIAFTTPSTFYDILLRIGADSGKSLPSVTLGLMVRRPDIIDSAFEPYHASVDESKANASALGTIENGTNASQAYAVGEHFSRFGDFCTVTQPIASGGTLTENTNYVVGDVSGLLTHLSTFTLSDVFSAYAKVSDIGLVKYGSVVQIRLHTTSVSIEPNTWNVIGTLKDEYKPLVACYETALNTDGEPAGWVRIKESGDIDIYHTGSANITCVLGAIYITAK